MCFVYVILPCKNGFVNILGGFERGFQWYFCKFFLKNHTKYGDFHSIAVKILVKFYEILYFRKKKGKETVNM